MAFPFSIRFIKPLKAVITDENKQLVLTYIQKWIIEKRGDNVSIGDNQVSYRGSTSNWKHSLFKGVDTGIFSLITSNGKVQLCYEYQVRRLIIQTGAISAFIIVFAQLTMERWWIGIIAFVWLCGGNWVIYAVRHESFVARMAVGIDNLIGATDKQKFANSTENDERLKSWF